MSLQGLFSIDKWDFNSESIIQDLPEIDYLLLTSHQTIQNYKKGDIILREGAYPFGIFYIISGKVKKYKLDREGKEHIIYVANNGELIGYHSILAEDRYTDSAAAIEDSIIAFIPKDDFIATINLSPVFNKRLLKTLSNEFAFLANNLSIFTQKSVRERLALQLIILREKYKFNFKPEIPVEVNIGREDLANLVGTARENVVRLLSEFKEENIIVTKGRKIVVLDLNKLIRIADYK
jgi:CRP-like cAMP-binding protein